MRSKKEYDEYEKQSNEYLKKIIETDVDKKIIIAGPGTGKSFLFRKICENNIKKGKTKNLALSFINELTEDLAKELHNISIVKTLHGFALKLLGKDNNFYLNISEIIQEDYKIINKKDFDFKKALCNLIECEDLKFYSERRKYYDSFGPDCSVYALVKYFEKYKEKIPKYSQILVDEFQDFNKLEIKLIDLLSTKSPILIVGDDDQSLYSFKYAEPKDIRLKHESGEFKPFDLPFCRRCTEVIINSFTDIIEKAKKEKFLKERKNKIYIYFPTEEKDLISEKNKKIIVKTGLQQIAIAYYIEKEIEKLFNPKEKNSVLIICPLKSQIKSLKDRLSEKGFLNIKTALKKEKNELIDGFKLLLKNKESNLGWRIIAKNILPKKQFKNILTESHKDESKKIIDLIAKDKKEKIIDILSVLKKFIGDEEVSEDESVKIFKFLGFDVKETIKENVLKEIGVNITKKTYKDVPIRITTILGSKGLTSDYVFMVNFDNKYMLKNGDATDEAICMFLVALTRAKKQASIYTSDKDLPNFVNWINPKNIDHYKINSGSKKF